MGSREDRHAAFYYQFAGVSDEQRETFTPDLGNNINFFFSYQLGHMFWRYFMWNFSGKQNDEQGNFYDNYKNGNWITGVEFIDKSKNPHLQNLPQSIADIMQRNVFFMIPFILGLLGMVYQLKKDKKGFLVMLVFFIFMGFMNLVNANEPPTEPRERDYALVGAFFAYAIWIGFGVAALYDMSKYTYQAISDKTKILTDTSAAVDSNDYKTAFINILRTYGLYAALIMLVMFFTGLTIYDFDSFLIITVYAVVVIAALGLIMLVIGNTLKNDFSTVLIAGALCLTAPVLMGAQGWNDHDRSERTFARDIARNYLESCPPNAILFTQGDNDTYPLWYAQEVEDIRTDVRIVNLSLLGVDWYINQLRHATNQSGPIALTLSYDKILGDKRNQIVANQESKYAKQTFELKDLIKFVGSDDRKYQLYSEGLEDYFNYLPTQNIKITVDGAKLLQNNLLPPDLRENIVSEMNVRLNRSTILKNDLMVLDIIASNINKKPICFAISVTPDSHLGLEKYLMQRNMVYQLMPVEIENEKSQLDGYRKNMNTDIQYDLLVSQKEKFTYGGVERGEKIYIDPSAAGSLYTTKYLNYLELAKSLNEERVYLEAQAKQMMKDSANNEYLEVGNQLLEDSKEKKQKALDVLNLMMQLFPHSSLPFDYNMVNVAQLYLQLGDNEKALEIVKTMADTTMQDIEYYYKMAQQQLGGMFETETRHAETSMYFITEVAKKAGDEGYAEDLNNRWQSLRTKYGVFLPDEQQQSQPPLKISP